MSTTESKRQRSPSQPVGCWIRPAKRLAICLRDRWACAYCGADLTDAAPADVTLDHLLPRNRRRGVGTLERGAPTPMPTTTRTVSRDLIEAAIDQMPHVQDIDLRDDYSGRGMYGEQCFGIVAASDTQFASFLVELAVLDPGLARDLARRATTDSMGRSTIWYFPGLTLDREDAQP